MDERGEVKLPQVPANTTLDENESWIRLKEAILRSIRHLGKAKVQAYSQFMPLHSSPYGKIHGYFAGEDRVTILTAAQILFLTVHADLHDAEQDVVLQELRKL